MKKSVLSQAEIDAFLAKGGTITKGKTQNIQKNMVYNSNNHIKLPKPVDTRPVKEVWNELRKTS